MAAGEIGDLEPDTLRTVPADHTLEAVIEDMLAEDFSQIGLTKDDELIGMVSFQSIARAMVVTDQVHRTKRPFAERSAELAVERPVIEDDDDELDELFDLLRMNSYVITENDEGEHGIVTNFDIREFYSGSLTPFIQIGETENAIRSIIRETFDERTEGIIADMSKDHEMFEHVESLEKCGFKHYELLISVNWGDGFSAFFNEHRDFVCHLIEKLATERNRLFHFRISGHKEVDRDVIRLAHNYFTGVCSTEPESITV